MYVSKREVAAAVNNRSMHFRRLSLYNLLPPIPLVIFFNWPIPIPIPLVMRMMTTIIMRSRKSHVHVGHE